MVIVTIACPQLLTFPKRAIMVIFSDQINEKGETFILQIILTHHFLLHAGENNASM